MTNQIWSHSKILDYLVLSLTNRRKYEEEQNRLLNLQEIKTSQVTDHINDVLEAFLPKISSLQLRIKVHNDVVFPVNNSESSD